MSLTLADQVALVTGGGNGIGKDYCQALAAAGAAVVVADINAPAAEAVASGIAASGGTALAIHMDVAREESVAAAAAQVQARFGRLDVLVNNAGIFMTLAERPFWEIPASEWDLVLGVNMKGMALVSKAVVPMMLAQGRGKIINVASATALKGRPYRLHYVSSKGGVIAMTRAMARELGPHNVNVNCLAPGLTVHENYLTVESPEYFAQALPSRAIQRQQTPDDLIGALLFLAGPASDFITGQTLVVDGGSAMV